MPTPSDTPTPDAAPDTATLVGWLREAGLTLPAWIALEALRPFGWLMGQACLVAEPLARGLGWEEPLAATIRWLDHPDALTTLSDALAPEREEP